MIPSSIKASDPLWSVLGGMALSLLIGGCKADAAIISTTGPVVIISAPVSVVPGKSVNKTDGQAFAELQDLTLGSALSVNATSPGKYNGGVGPGGTISAGTDVNSYFVLFDSGGKSVTYPTVTLTFSTEILGVIFSDSLLNKSDLLLGDPGTTYPTGVGNRGQESGDSTAISASGLTITLNDTTSYPGDDIRIITAGAHPISSIPEPRAWGLFAIGITSLGFLRGRKKTAKKRMGVVTLPPM
jgi:hypothetical protein